LKLAYKRDVTNALAAGVGWRTALAAIGVCAAVLVLGSRAILPNLPPVPGRTGDRHRGSLRGALAISVITLKVVTAYFATYTYVTPLLAGAGVPSPGQPLILFAFGGAGLVGIALAGRFVDVHPRATSMTQTTTMLLALAGLLLAPADTVNTVAMLLVLSLGYAGLAVSWQTMVLRAAPRAPDRASSIYVVAFQVGIGTGPILGGTLRDLLSPTAAIAASVTLAAAGTVMTAGLGAGRACTRNRWSSKPAAE
jgi:predicted MFS family arabinose efflux permease